jgi:hypothetical protein
MFRRAALLAFESEGGACHLVIGSGRRADGTNLFGARVWDPEEGRPVPHGLFNRGCPLDTLHLMVSGQGRYVLAIAGRAPQPPRHPGPYRHRGFLDMYDIGACPAPTG